MRESQRVVDDRVRESLTKNFVFRLNGSLSGPNSRLSGSVQFRPTTAKGRPHDRCRSVARSPVSLTLSLGAVDFLCASLLCVR